MAVTIAWVATTLGNLGRYPIHHTWLATKVAPLLDDPEAWVRKAAAGAPGKLWSLHSEKTLAICSRYAPNAPNEPPIYLNVTNFNRPIVGACSLRLRKFLIVDRDILGLTYLVSDKNFEEEFIAKDKTPHVNRIKTIGGYAFAVCDGRSIFKRVAAKEWILVETGIPKGSVSLKHGFEDLDAFSCDDMYAVGGDGDVWRYEGKKWSRASFVPVLWETLS